MNCAAARHNERFAFDGISWLVQGSGAPLLLVHNINATGSAAKVRPLYEHHGATRTHWVRVLRQPQR